MSAEKSHTQNTLKDTEMNETDVKNKNQQHYRCVPSKGSGILNKWKIDMKQSIAMSLNYIIYFTALWWYSVI